MTSRWSNRPHSIDSIDHNCNIGYFLEHNTINRLRSKDLNVVAGLPVPMDYDCVYDSV